MTIEQSNEKLHELKYNQERYNFLRDVLSEGVYTLPANFLLKEFIGWDDEKIKMVTKLYKSHQRKLKNSYKLKCSSMKSCCDVHENEEDTLSE